MTSLPLVSVIIPTFQRELELRNTIAALLRQPYPRFELIVADQTPHHDPETEAYLESVGGQIRYFRLPEPGYVESNNFGALQARGDILLFLDDDIIPTEDLIGHHVRAFTDPTVGAVAGRVIDERRHIVEDDPVGRVLGTGEIVASFSATRASDAETIPGGNVSIRRDVFRRVGGFPRGYIGTAAFSDSELGFRVKKSGYRVRFVPEAEIFHLRAPTGGCGNRVGGFMHDYGHYHNAMLFAWRWLPPRGVARAFVVRAKQSARKAYEQRQPWQLVLPMIAAAHAGVRAGLSTRLDRHPSRMP